MGVDLILLIATPLFDLTILDILEGQFASVDIEFVIAFSGEPKDLAKELAIEA